MKKTILSATLAFLTYSVSFAQWTGTNPENLNGSANLTGNLTVGSAFVPSPSQKLNLYNTYTGSPASGAPLSDYATGIKITHRFSPTGSSFTNYNWEMGADKEHLYFHYSNDNRTLMTLKSEGKAGIGVINPDATLHIANINNTDLDAHIEGFTLLDGNQASLLLGRETGAPYGEWGIEYNHQDGGLNFWKPAGATTGGGNYHLFIKDNGKVSIGLDPNLINGFGRGTYEGAYKLYVAEGILTEKVKVALRSSDDWADFVFDPNYELISLSEVEQFIQNNGHLPHVPSADEVKKNGIDLGKMDATLLQKIEELTLYVIELKKENHVIKNQLSGIKQ